VVGDAISIKDLLKHPRLQPLSYFEAQARLVKLARTNASWATKSGKRGAWMVTPAGLEIMVRLRQLELEGSSIDSAIEKVVDETRPPSQAESEPSASASATPNAIWRLEEENRVLRERNEDLIRERDRLWGVLEGALLALPKPPTARRSFRLPWRREA